ncbi:MAG TPA: PilZ domain-containing protein [Polyangia bacterium]|nr:PilZ domain-containing protein [Polyangia bacterium]
MPSAPREQTHRNGGRTDMGRANRVALEVPVQLRGGSTSFSGVARNIGPGGVFVATIRLLAVGEKVTLTLDLRGDAQPISALAEVRWCRPFVELDDRPAGVGLRFIDTPLRAAVLANELRRSRG